MNLSNLLIKKFKGKYTTRVEFDINKNDFNRKFNGTYEDMDVYIPCRNQCKIFHYGHNQLQFYCPSLGRGRNIIRTIYSKYINPDNTIINKTEYDVTRNGQQHIIKENVQIKDDEQFQQDIKSKDSIIYDIEETDEEVLLKFKYQDMDTLKDILNRSTIACNRSPFSSKNLLKSDYKIPDKDLEAYKNITANIPKENLISLVHISQSFINKKANNKKQVEEYNRERKQLGMKPKEYFHYKSWWKEYLEYLKEELKNVN